MNQEWAAVVQTAVLIQQRMTVGVPTWHWLQCVQHAMQSSEDEVRKLIGAHGNISLAAVEFCAWKGGAVVPEPQGKIVNAETIIELQNQLAEFQQQVNELNTMLGQERVQLGALISRAEQAEVDILKARGIIEAEQRWKGEQRERAGEAEYVLRQVMALMDAFAHGR